MHASGDVRVSVGGERPQKGARELEGWLWERPSGTAKRPLVSCTRLPRVRATTNTHRWVPHRCKGSMYDAICDAQQRECNRLHTWFAAAKREHQAQHLHKKASGASEFVQHGPGTPCYAHTGPRPSAVTQQVCKWRNQSTRPSGLGHRQYQPLCHQAGLPPVHAVTVRLRKSPPDREAEVLHPKT